MTERPELNTEITPELIRELEGIAAQTEGLRNRDPQRYAEMVEKSAPVRDALLRLAKKATKKR